MLADKNKISHIHKHALNYVSLRSSLFCLEPLDVYLLTSQEFPETTQNSITTHSILSKGKYNQCFVSLFPPKQINPGGQQSYGFL